MFDNWNIYEVAWTLTAFVTVLFTASVMLDSWKSYKSVANLENGRKIIAWGYVRRDILRISTHLIWLLLGLMGGIFDSRPTANPFGAIVLIITMLLLLLNTILDKKENVELRKSYASAQE